MKRLVCILLAAALLFGIAATAGAEFYDEKDLPADRRTAIDYVAGKGVITGYPDRDFKPKETLTRAQAAKILCVALEGAAQAESALPAESGFADVPASHWAAGFVAYCAKKNIVAGVGEGKFGPDAKLSSAAFAKMLLVAYGHDPAKEGLVGADWIQNTDKALKASGFDTGFKEVKDAALNRADACQLTYNFLRAAEEKALAAQGYSFETFPVSEKQNYRVLGRGEQTDDAIVCDMPGAGIEFQIDCAGTLWATVDTEMADLLHFRAYVDGVMGDAITFKPTLKTQPLFSDLKPGVHTIRIIRDRQPDRTRSALTAFSVCAKKETVKPTAPKSLYIEFVGDSISAGYGLYGSPKGGSTPSYSIGPAYDRRAADLLDADFSVIARGGIGLVRKAGPGKDKSKKATSDLLYDYRNYYRDRETKYDFARKPDIVVFELGTNDNMKSTKEEDYYEICRKFFAQIRERNNDPALKIVILYNMMTDLHADTFLKLAAEDPNVWALKVPTDCTGMGKHPTGESHVLYAQLLADFIKTIR